MALDRAGGGPAAEDHDVDADLIDGKGWSDTKVPAADAGTTGDGLDRGRVVGIEGHAAAGDDAIRGGSGGCVAPAPDHGFGIGADGVDRHRERDGHPFLGGADCRGD